MLRHIVIKPKSAFTFKAIFTGKHYKHSILGIEHFPSKPTWIYLESGFGTWNFEWYLEVLGI